MKMKEKEMDGKVVNLHYTDICNYRCRFCYAKFSRTPLTLDEWKKIIDNISGDICVKRFNLAGGEPMATPYIQGLVDYIHSCGIEVSIITNGSLLTEEFIRKNQGKISMIGISIDALSAEDNLALGRVNGAGKALSAERLKVLTDTIHDAGIKLKINTVVNAVNCRKDFSSLIQNLRPDRWKLLRMLRIAGTNDAGIDLLVSDTEFADFVTRHEFLNPIVENTLDIVNAYIVVNPYGELVDNSDSTYTMTNSLLTHRFRDEFAKIAFNQEAYSKRY